jgi:hypothetical protein
MNKEQLEKKLLSIFTRECYPTWSDEQYQQTIVALAQHYSDEAESDPDFECCIHFSRFSAGHSPLLGSNL